ncbi:hypothetical protein NIES2109_42420 [Nostoc sp. HK-01]|nr:hypothetical protein NIES2109_42420 [Nostoc sp. HK-01]
MKLKILLGGKQGFFKTNLKKHLDNIVSYYGRVNCSILHLTNYYNT